LLAFDVATAIPAGSTIISATLTMEVSKVGPLGSTYDYSLYRVQKGWGEGTSDAGAIGGQGVAATENDATWIHSKYDTERWDSAGGDFAATASASTAVGSEGSYTWASTNGLVSDVQSWLDDPNTNYGWLLMGNESATKSAKRFNAREHPDESTRPTLKIFYQTPASSRSIQFLPIVYQNTQ
jgi:hypothetical protein